MVVDTSALIAILIDEPERLSFAELIQHHKPVLVSTATAVELLIVALGKGETIYQDAIAILDDPTIQLVELDYQKYY